MYSNSPTGPDTFSNIATSARAKMNCAPCFNTTKLCTLCLMVAQQMDLATTDESLQQYAPSLLKIKDTHQDLTC
eukprot:8654186-Ditylum_brightwellii.AAC.1